MENKHDKQTMISTAKELFNDNMKDFTKEEAEIYKDSLNKIYKKTGVNVFDVVEWFSMSCKFLLFRRKSGANIVN